MAKKLNKVVPIQQVESLIYFLRGQKAMLDSDLAALYGVPTKVFNQAVRRNLDRFPDDFMFQLSEGEFERMLRSQIVTASESNSSQIVMSSGKKSKKASKNADYEESVSKDGESVSSGMRSQIVTAYKRNIRFRPYVFTEQGIAMLSSVLRSPRAVQVNIEIMRAFVKIRQWLASNAELSKRLVELENKYDKQFKIVFDAIRELMIPPEKPKREIGFHTLQPKASRKSKSLSKV
ncbi:MAG: ORF6N domain-containing protein [Verrucomicrobiota bacterium]